MIKSHACGHAYHAVLTITESCESLKDIEMRRVLKSMLLYLKSRPKTPVPVSLGKLEPLSDPVSEMNLKSMSHRYVYTTRPYTPMRQVSPRRKQWEIFEDVISRFKDMSYAKVTKISPCLKELRLGVIRGNREKRRSAQDRVSWPDGISLSERPDAEKLIKAVYDGYVHEGLEVRKVHDPQHHVRRSP